MFLNMENTENEPLDIIECAVPISILNDLCSRFLINFHPEAKKNIIRICFLIESAYGHYLNYFCIDDYPNTKPLSLKQLASIILQHLPFLKPTAENEDGILDNRRYKPKFRRQFFPKYTKVEVTGDKIKTSDGLVEAIPDNRLDLVETTVNRIETKDNLDIIGDDLPESTDDAINTSDSKFLNMETTENEPFDIMRCALPISILNDLCNYFLINVSPEAKRDIIRISFLIESAYGHYLNYFCIDGNPNNKPLTLKQYAQLIFQHLPVLKPTAENDEERILGVCRYKPKYRRQLFPTDHKVEVTGNSVTTTGGLLEAIPDNRLDLVENSVNRIETKDNLDKIDDDLVNTSDDQVDLFNFTAPSWKNVSLDIPRLLNEL